jgi:hypothetical protein
MLNKFLNARRTITLIVLAIACLQCNYPAAQKRDKKAISADQPPADNLKLIRGIQRYFPEIVWWMNWNYAYSICTDVNSNYNSSELLNHPWVINRDEIKLHSFK